MVIVFHIILKITFAKKYIALFYFSFLGNHLWLFLFDVSGFISLPLRFLPYRQDYYYQWCYQWDEVVVTGEKSKSIH